MSVSQDFRLLRIAEFLYLSLISSAFYLLLVSRTGEAQTVWQVLHPAFIPTLLVATSLLLAILLFTTEKTSHKLLFVILHSILVHSLFSVIFPAGDTSGQQLVLGRTRRVFDNTILHGLSGWPTRTIQIFIVEAFMGINLQAVLTTIFARMLSTDIFYVHLFYIPVLWGVFTPIASYLAAKAIGAGEKAAVLSSLLVSVFPYSIYFGAISVPNSLGFILFFYVLYFILKYLSSTDPKALYWMVAFSLFSFLSHYLTGVMSFSFLLLAVAFKAYENEKRSSSTNARVTLAVSFLASVSLLPLSFVYLKYFGTSSNPVFTLDKLYELSFQEVVTQFVLGDMLHVFDLETMLAVVLGPLIAFLGMMYFLYTWKKDIHAQFRLRHLFLLAAFLVVSIDFGFLTLFMEGLPLNVERLFVCRDFIAVPFAALILYEVVSSMQISLRLMSPRIVRVPEKTLSKSNNLRIFSLLLAFNVLISLFVGGWVTFSLSAGYPQTGLLQTTWYELEAVRRIESDTHEKYVVIGDAWTVYAGEMIVGVENPEAYYFAPFNMTGYDLFVKMRQNPSSEWMILAMNNTDTTLAYFIVTEPRLGTEEFNNVVSKASQNNLPIYATFGNGKLYVFYTER